MRKLIHRLMLTCEEATRLVAIRRYKKLTFRERMKLSVHLFVCKYCKRFAIFSDLVDDAIEHSCSNPPLSDQKLSEEKKHELYDLINRGNKMN